MSNEKFDERFLYFNFILKNPVAFRDFFAKDVYGKNYKTRLYQYAPAFADDKIMRAGRTLGKSVDLVLSVIQKVILDSSSEFIVTTFRKTHLRDRMEQIIKFFKVSPIFKSLLDGRGVCRQPIYEVRFKNKNILYGIAVGDDPQAVSIQGKHCRWRYCLEGDVGILLSNGKRLAIRHIISKIKKGEEIYVKSYDYINKKIVNVKVKKGFANPIEGRKLLRVILEDNTSFVVTDDHVIYTEGYVPKKAGDLIPQKDYIISSDFKLSEGQKAVIVGGLFGDGCIHKNKFRKNDIWTRGKKRDRKFYKKASYRMHFVCASTHAEYMEFKRKVLGNLTHETFTKITKCHPKSFGHSVATCRTKSLVALDRIASLIIKDDKKYISKEILDLVNEKSLAIWYCDDGHLNLGRSGVVHGVDLHTEGFSYEEHLIIKDWFKKRWDLDVNIRAYRKYYKTSFSGKDGLKFLKIILPYAHPLFAYKFVNIEIDISKIGARLHEFFDIMEEPLSKQVLSVIPYSAAQKLYKVYDLELEKFHNFFAGTACVSNCDEAQTYTMPAYIQFQEARDERESHDCLYGVPDGRIGTPFTLKNFIGNPRFKDGIFNKIPRYMNPYWNQVMKQERILAFGGIESEAYKEQILGEDGAPSSSAWDVSVIMSNQEINPIIISIPKAMLDQYKLEDLLLGDLPESPLTEEVFMGVDIGFDQPTQIVSFKKGNDGKYRQMFRIELKDRIPYHVQVTVLEALLRFYLNSYIGIDTTSDGGRAVADMLRVREGLEIRVVDVQFNSSVLKGFNTEGKEVKETVKSFTSVKLSNMFAGKILSIMSGDEDMLEEFQLEARRRTLKGETVYFTKGTDHIIAAFRCFAYLVYMIAEGGIEFDMRSNPDYGMMLPEMVAVGIPIFGSEYAHA